MNLTPELNRKLELYAGSRLEGRELHDFEQLLERDPELLKEARFRKAVVDAIAEVRLLELKNYINEKANVQLASNPWGKVWTVASLAIIGIAVAFYFVDFNKIIPKENFKPDKQKTTVKPTAVTPIKRTDTTANSENIINDITEKQESNKENNTIDTTITGESPKNIDTSITDYETGEEIIVKRDELVATINLKPIDKSAIKQPPQENLSGSTIEKLNPEAKLPETPQQELFRVELWRSPINFKGYRLVKNRLTLFGVEQNVILRLYKIDDNYFLEYEPNTFSKLYPGDQFNAFVRIRDTEILTQLSQ